MSSYEYYGFRAIDRPLTKSEMRELRRYSSRAEISTSGFEVEYNYSSFNGDPEALLAKYFDCYVYVSSWEIRILMIRIPANLFAPADVEPYLSQDAVTCKQVGDHLVLELAYRPEEGSEWAEGEGWMDVLVPVRSALIQGDLRPLYLGWLAGATLEYEEEQTVEPPVPPGLSECESSYLKDLREFLKLDEDLVAAAAERSAPPPSDAVELTAIERWVSNLSGDRKDELLTDLVANRSASLGEALRREALEQTGVAGQSAPGTRTLAELEDQARAIDREQRRKKREDARRKREAYILSLKGREDEKWNDIEALIDSTSPKRYADIVDILLELRELARNHGGLEEFGRRTDRLRAESTNRPSLIRRLNEAAL